MTHSRHNEVNASWVSALAEALSVPVGETEAGSRPSDTPGHRPLTDLGSLSPTLEARAHARGPIAAQPTEGRSPRLEVASPVG